MIVPDTAGKSWDFTLKYTTLRWIAIVMGVLALLLAVASAYYIPRALNYNR